MRSSLMRKKIILPWQVIVCALFVFIITNLFSFFIFKHIPHINDEIAYLFQAKIFKMGRLYATSPCIKEAFYFTHIINNEKWYSQYPPGYPALLLLGLLLHVPWLINPFFAALSIVLFYYLGKEIYDSHVGLLAALFGAISIWFLLMSSSMMSHTTCMFFTSLFLLFLFRSFRKPSITNGLLAGFGLGMAFLIRPYTVIFLSFPFLFLYALKSLKNFKSFFRNSMALAFVLIISVCLFLFFNYLTTDSFLTTGYEVCHGKEHGIGFGKTGYTDRPHTVFMGFKQIFDYLKELNKYLFGWPLSSFFALFPLFFLTKMRPDERKKDLVLTTGFLSLLIGLFFFWGTYILIGPRMLFESIPILLLLSARGYNEAPNLIGSIWNRDKGQIKKILAAHLIIFTAFAFSIRLPRWISPPYTQWYYHGFANKFAAVTPDINRTIQSIQIENAVVLMKFIYHPIEFFPYGWWGSGFLYNNPQLTGNIIYARYLGEENKKIFHCFPERKFFLYFGTLEKGMLIPLKKEEGKISHGNPISIDNKKGKFVEVIDQPQKFFQDYSDPYKEFIDRIYEQNDFINVDVPFLAEKGRFNKNNKNYKEAAFWFEAALQLEKQPEIRYRLLNHLNACYLKLGQMTEANKIMERISGGDFRKLYNILPEKGI